MSTAEATRISTRSRSYERWLLFLLVLIYASSMTDRILVAIVGPVLKREMGLSDFQLGLLSGLAFSIFYATLGIPIGRLAERYNRKLMISVSIVAWSLMTMLCGTAGSFASMMVYRLGVGIGEAGSTPTSHSLLSDQFPPSKRATVYGIYALGPAVGVFIGAFGGGTIAHLYGWRMAFYAFGFPGIILGLIAYFTLREPKRGNFDSIESKHVPALKEVLAAFVREKPFWQMSLGIVTTSISIYGTFMFQSIYMGRTFGLNMQQAGLTLAIVNGVGAFVGGLIGGYGSDWMAKRDRRWYGWIPAVGSLLGIPFTIISFTSMNFAVSTVAMFLMATSLNVWNGPSFSVIHSRLEPRMRATASALVFLLMNLVGQGLGPAWVGWMSDRFAANIFTGSGDYAAACKAPIVDAVAASCHVAGTQGLRYAMIAPIIMVAIATWSFFAAARSIGRSK
ncbi:putative MFS family arabinose efflux permease [Paraburkholderia youngii]|uniref:spinster family MFS transporter n=1 Tax=Paraburkholderia youngii TaxID=2782701 RepID=UPI003D2394BC